jgi:hypothetical protein
MISAMSHPSFDPSQQDPAIGLQIRNLVDSPAQQPRGGGSLQTAASQTGRRPTSQLPEFKTIPDAEVQILNLDGRPIRGTTSLGDGSIGISGLVDIQAGDDVLVVAHRGEKTDAKKVRTVAVR